MNQMLTLKRRLMSLEKEIRVGIIFSETVNYGLIQQIHTTIGMTPAAIAVNDPRVIAEFITTLHLDYDIVSTLDDLNFSIQRGRVALTDKAELLTNSRLINVLIESSNNAYSGALNATKAIRNHQHVIMMNLQADLMYGPLLLRMADEEGMVYSCADGTHPAAIKKMIDDLELWGFDIVMAGCITGYHDRYANPASISNQARAKKQDLKQYTSDMDGTSLNIDMAILANGINARTLVPGMHGKAALKIRDIFHLFNLENKWNGINPIVDYISGANPEGSTFVIGHSKQTTGFVVDPDLKWGSYTLFYRPFRLGHIEISSCIAEAYLDYNARHQPMYGMKTNVFTYAKKALQAGDRLDGAGGYQTYGAIENITGTDLGVGLPILLSGNLRLKRNIEKDQRINLEDVEYDAEDPAFILYRRAQLHNVITPLPPRPFEETQRNLSDTNAAFVFDQ